MYSRFPTRSNTNRSVLPQKMAIVLKFRTWEVEGLYYLCSEKIIIADQLGSVTTQLMCAFFPICKIAGILK